MFNWSERQKAVISHRNKNMLVSAAAGSGKTAVLVNRVISLITDRDNPVDLDRLLIVTFTRAAAEEMKERIRGALEEMISGGSTDERIRNQSVLIHNAHISTLHSFCSYVIKNYFYSIDIDPSYRIMDDGEVKLMMADCARETLADAYESADAEIMDFAAAYSTGKSSKKINELIIQTYNIVSAQAWPDEWMENAASFYEADSKEELEMLPELAEAYNDAASYLNELKEAARQNLEAAKAARGPAAYIPALEADIRLIDDLITADGFNSLSEKLADVSFEKLSASKKKDEDAELRERIKNKRNEIKATIEELKKGIFASDFDEIIRENKICRPHVNALTRLLKDFSESYASKKRAKNLMDYTDLEHFTLKILLKRNEDGSIERTQAAKEIVSGLDYVMTDEYQDSNDIQELILHAVSGNDEGRNNRFMVGDIKQSIYGFRNASPEIFVDKYEKYAKDGINSEVIDLHDNYRSSASVIDSLNYLFTRVMSRDAGGVDYDDAQALHLGIKEDDDNSPPLKSELILLNSDDSESDGKKSADENRETEAVLIAAEIKKLVTDTGFSYSDCAVLTRTTALAESICRVLQAQGVPSYTESKSGYFTTVEVSTILNYISIIDNPLQDIAFTAVLFSPIVGCTADDLAKIRINKREVRFYYAAEEYVKTGTDENIKARLSVFFKDYVDFVEKSKYMSVHKLISEIYVRTGYRSYVSAMPGGDRRQANLDMLLQRADSYEKTSYKGLFNFIRYIEELKKDDNDFGEANAFSGGSNAVCVMTMHKSKGLEFPVVFVSGLAGQFNKMSSRGNVLIHKDMGIGMDAIDYDGAKKKITAYKKLIASEMNKEFLSEEIRVLYVALTRAKRKLYMTACTSGLEKKIAEALEQGGSGPIPYHSLLNANSFLDIIFLGYASHAMFEPLAHYAEIYDAAFVDSGDYIQARILSEGDLAHYEETSKNRLAENVKKLPKSGDKTVHDGEMRALLNDIESFNYPYKNGAVVPLKVSVSQIKRMHLVTDEEQKGFELDAEEEIIPYIPKFMEENETDAPGTARGTAYHKFWEHFDYAMIENTAKEDLVSIIGKMLKEQTDSGILDEKEAELIKIQDFADFASSDTGRRMLAAQLRDELKREQQFSALVDAAKIKTDWQSEEPIVVQGVIDAYFKEDDGYVIVDYKTDGVSDEEELIERYRAQIDVYADVLGKMPDVFVKEKIIYSTSLKKSISVE